MRAHYRGEEDGLSLYEAGFGALFVKAAGELPTPGQAVMLSFRPEAISVSFDGKPKPSPNPLRVILEHLTYLGESEQLLLQTADAQQLRATIFNPPSHALVGGVPVICCVAPEHIMVLPDDRGDGVQT